jgi:hypothetical protein
MTAMSSCPSCGAERAASSKNAPCAACGAGARPAPPTGAPDFELDMPKRSAPKTAAPRKIQEEATLELAVEPRSFAASTAASDGGSNAATVVQPAQALILRQVGQGGAALSVGDVAFDARLLADYGDPPKHWLLAPFYAWRVLRRRRELRRGLAGRLDEAKRAATEVEDALVAFAERTRPVAEKHSEFARSSQELRGAEDVLRSRDRVLATEQDAQTARLAAVDARLAKLEAELAHAQAEERGIAGELASAQAALARGESKLRRAESELRAAQQREGDGSHA